LPRWLGRRRTLTVVVLLGLLAAAGFGLRQVRQDPIRYGLDFPPLVDGADYGEAYLVKQLRRGVERTAGPYIGPNPNLSDVVGALNLKTSGPTGQPTFSEVLSSTVTQGHDFTGQAEALVRLCFHGAGWLLPSDRLLPGHREAQAGPGGRCRIPVPAPGACLRPSRPAEHLQRRRCTAHALRSKHQAAHGNGSRSGSVQCSRAALEARVVDR
jgi:hypothetical protein